MNLVSLYAGLAERLGVRAPFGQRAPSIGGVQPAIWTLSHMAPTVPDEDTTIRAAVITLTPTGDVECGYRRVTMVVDLGCRGDVLVAREGANDTDSSWPGCVSSWADLCPPPPEPPDPHADTADLTRARFVSPQESVSEVIELLTAYPDGTEEWRRRLSAVFADGRDFELSLVGPFSATIEPQDGILTARCEGQILHRSRAVPLTNCPD